VKPVNVLIGIVAVLALLFLILNWGTLIPISFGFARVTAPLGLVLLALLLLLAAVFFGLLLTLQLRLAAAHRRHSAELRSHRELADNAEASRYTELRQYLQQQLDALSEAQRLAEQRLHAEIQTTSNTLSACIGEIDERLERQWPSPPSAQP
jgi:DNA anti-recombination protein RmuC